MPFKIEPRHGKAYKTASVGFPTLVPQALPGEKCIGANLECATAGGTSPASAALGQSYVTDVKVPSAFMQSSDQVLPVWAMAYTWGQHV